MRKGGLKLVRNVNNVNRNLKSENSQDYAQKAQRNVRSCLAGTPPHHPLFLQTVQLKKHTCRRCNLYCSAADHLGQYVS
jgi:hypothetical protein